MVMGELRRCCMRKRKEEEVQQSRWSSPEEGIPAPAGKAPWLIYPSSLNPGQTLFYNLNIKTNHGDDYHYSDSFSDAIRIIPELSTRQIRACCHGWLLLQGKCPTNGGELLLFNPTSSQQIKLPLLDPDPELDPAFGGFGNYGYEIYTFTPPYPLPMGHWDCAVLLLCGGRAKYCRPTHRRWNCAHQILLQGSGDKVYIRAAVGCDQNEVVYAVAVATDHAMAYFDVVIPVSDLHWRSTLSSLTVMPFHVESDPDSRRGDLIYLFKSCGELFTASVLFNHSTSTFMGFFMWKWDMNQNNWVLVTCLKDCTLFLGKNCCTWCPILDGEPMGRVYFTVDRQLYLYSMQDDSITSLLVCLSDLHAELQLDMPSWVMTKHHGCHIGRVLEEAYADISLPRSKKRKYQYSIVGVEAALEDYRYPEDEAVPKDDPFSRLPIQVTELIAKCLEVFDYLSFRATCKTFHSVTPVGLKYYRTVSFPFLMAYRLPDDSVPSETFSIVDPCRSEESYAMSIPKSCVGRSMFAFKDGWLLLSDYGDKNDLLKFYNPFTREGITLTSGLISLDWLEGVGFSTSPTSPAGSPIVVAILGWIPGNGSLLIGYWELGYNKWRTISFDLTGKLQLEFEQSCNPSVYHDGAFYFLDVKGYLGVLRSTGGEPKFSWDVYDKPEALNVPPYCSSHLVVCGGELLDVFIGKSGKWVQVFRLNRTNMDWVKVESLGDEYSLCVSSLSSFAVTTRDQPGMGDRIYLPRLQGQTGVVYYSLKSGKFHSFRSEDSMQDFCGTKELMCSFWVKPEWVSFNANC